MKYLTTELYFEINQNLLCGSKNAVLISVSDMGQLSERNIRMNKSY